MDFEEWYYRNFPLPTTDVALERKRWMKLLWEDAFEEGYKQGFDDGYDSCQEQRSLLDKEE